MSAGAGWRSWVGGDAVVSYLFITRDWDEAPSLAVAEFAGYAMMAAAVLMWLRRGWPALIVAGGWMAIVAYMTMAQRVTDWQLIPGTHAVRYIGPFDGHDIVSLEEAFANASEFDGPVLVRALARPSLEAFA